MKYLKRIATLIICVGLFKIAHLLPLEHPMEPEYFTLGMALIVVLLFGIPHGATDYLLSNVVENIKSKEKLNAKFLIKYVLIMMSFALVWYINGAVALLIFLLVSAYHFGETQWFNAEKQGINKITLKPIYFFWGLSLLGSLFLLNNVSTYQFVKFFVDTPTYSITISALKIIVPLSILIWISLSIKAFKIQKLIFQVIEFTLIILMFHFTDLIYGFAVYFGLFHSRDAILAQIDILKKTYSEHFGWKSFYKFALPITLLSIVGIALIFYLVYYLKLEANFITLFFILISLVTMPHMWIIEKFYERR